MGSSRLPGKILRDIAGKPMLRRVCDRAAAARGHQGIVVLTSVSPQDDEVAAFCRASGISFFRGHENDVLDRYYHAAVDLKCDAVIRITADCPLLDPAVLDRLIDHFRQVSPDYASNILTRTFPRGLDAEIMTFATLERAWREASEAYQRTHVTPYIYQHPEAFRLSGITAERDASSQRWTVDTAEDLEFIRAVYERFRPKDLFQWEEVYEAVERDPALSAINRNIRQKDLHEG